MKYMIHNWRGKPDVPCVYNKYYTSNTSTINHSKHLNFVTLQQLKEDFPNMKDFHIPHWSAWHHPLSFLPMYYVHVFTSKYSHLENLTRAFSSVDDSPGAHSASFISYEKELRKWIVQLLSVEIVEYVSNHNKIYI